MSEHQDRRRGVRQPAEVVRGGGVGADHRDAFAGWVEAGIPRRGVKRRAAELVAPGDVGQPGHLRRPVCGDDDIGAPELAAGRGQPPGVGVVVEPGPADFMVGPIQGDQVGESGGAQGGSDAPPGGSRAHDRDVAAAPGALARRRHRNLLRFQPRRASGPIRPTSVRNAARGANPAIWISRRWALVRAVFRARLGSRPARA